jgi:hypothetical protein
MWWYEGANTIWSRLGHIAFVLACGLVGGAVILGLAGFHL